MIEQIFNCEDCGRRVHAWVIKPVPACATCEWIRSRGFFPDEEAALRKRLKVEKISKTPVLSLVEAKKEHG